MTTLRLSAIGTSTTMGGQRGVRTPVGLAALPARPDADGVRPRLTVLLIESVRFVALRCRKGPRTGHRICDVGVAQQGVAPAVAKVSDIDDGKHHHKCSECWAGAEGTEIARASCRER